MNVILYVSVQSSIIPIFGQKTIAWLSVPTMQREYSTCWGQAMALAHGQTLFWSGLFLLMLWRIYKTAVVDNICIYYSGVRSLKMTPTRGIGTSRHAESSCAPQVTCHCRYFKLAHRGTFFDTIQLVRGSWGCRRTHTAWLRLLTLRNRTQGHPHVHS
jgi:hypothetical protein